MAQVHTPNKLLLCLFTITLLSIAFMLYMSNDIFFASDTYHVIATATTETSHALPLQSRPDYPALVLQGPPKSGTRTFVGTLSRYNDVVQYGPERDFWAGPNKWRCFVRYQRQRWHEFIIAYRSHNESLSSLVDAVIGDEFPENSVCNADRYRWHWDKIQNYGRGPVGRHWRDKQCHHPNTSISSNSTYHRYCYLIEKGPVYARAPWVSLIYMHAMPRIKLLSIVRDPLKQIMSTVFAFSFATQAMSMSLVHERLVQNMKTDAAWLNLTAMCSQLNTEWNALAMDDGKHRYLSMKAAYRDYMLVYFWRRFRNQEFLETPRREIYKWATMIFPTLVTTLNAWDELKGEAFMRHEWHPRTSNEYYETRYVQFEWMYSNVASAMKQIKCWMMDVRDTTVCDGFIDDEENRRLFMNVTKSNSVAPNQPTSAAESEYFTTNMFSLYEPCSTALQHIIRYDRPQLLLGNWIEYDWQTTPSFSIQSKTTKLVS